MAGPPELPSWMSNPGTPSSPPPPAPPPPPPPPMAPSPYGADPFDPPMPVSTTLLTLVCAMNLIFAVVCGCPSAVWAKVVSHLADRTGEPMVMSEEDVDGLAQAMTSGGRGRANDQEDLKVVLTTMLKEHREELNREVDAARSAPALPKLRMATLLLVGGKVVLLVASVLLLMRLSIGRLLTMLGLATVLAGAVMNAVTWAAFAPDVATFIANFHVHFTESVKSAKAGGHVFVSSFEQMYSQLDVYEKGAGPVGTVLSLVTAVWPAIALLIVLFSGTIKRACAPRTS